MNRAAFRRVTLNGIARLARVAAKEKDMTTTTLLHALRCADEVDLNGYELDGKNSIQFEANGQVHLEGWDDHKYTFVDQNITLDDDGNVEVVDTDGVAHTLTFNMVIRRSLMEYDLT